MFIQFVIGVIAGALLMFQLPEKPSTYHSVYLLLIAGVFVVLFIGYLRYSIKNTHFLIDKESATANSSAKSKPKTRNYFNPLVKKSYRLFVKLKRGSLFNQPQDAFSIMPFIINLLGGVALGVALVSVQMLLQPSFDQSLYSEKFLFMGEVVSVPVIETHSRFQKVSFQIRIRKVLNAHFNNDMSHLSNGEDKKEIKHDLRLKEVKHNPPNFQNTDVYAWSFNKPVIKVNWYLGSTSIGSIESLPKQGQAWALFGKLKSNHASFNYFARDYEAWLFQQGHSGRLSVSGDKTLSSNYQNAWQALRSDSEKSNEMIKDFIKTAQPISKLPKHFSEFYLENDFFAQSRQIVFERFSDVRTRVFNHLDQMTLQSPFSEIYKALLLGNKSGISTAQWQLFQQTGTIHLMAISGLHMSIMALIGFLIAKALWWLFVYRQNKVTLPAFGAFLSWIFASYYLLISGGAIPTQRAWIMVSTVILFLSLRRSFQPFAALSMAALFVLIWDVKAVLSSGFWLSFLAVWLIFSSLSLMQGLSKWHKTLLVQFVLSLGLLPMIAWLYYEVPSYSLLANLVAVPFVTLLGLPLLLLAQLTSLFSSALSMSLFALSDELWRALFDFLITLQSWPFAMLNIPRFSVLNLILFYLGWMVILSFSKQTLLSVYQKSLGIWLLLLIMMLYTVLSAFLVVSFKTVPVAQSGEVEVTVFDVGQGQAVAFKTQKHLVVYDAGAKWGSKTDAAKIAILPYFKAQNLDTIDLFMVSHSDIDHAGGTQTIVDNLTVNHALSGQADKLNEMMDFNTHNTARVNSNLQTHKNAQARFKSCVAGQKWQYDGVIFSVISPSKTSKNLTDNDWSCVLKVTTGAFSVLVMGDLSTQAEQRLLKKNQHNTENFKSDILIAGHHGSRYSTSNEWLNAVNPSMVVFSSGYQNRYGFPSSEVITRIEKQNSSVRWWNTACSGALRFKLNRDGFALENEARKNKAKWYHHRCLPSQQGIFYQ